MFAGVLRGPSARDALSPKALPGRKIWNSPDVARSVRKHLIMTTDTDPPSDEREKADIWKWLRAQARKLVTRKTLLLAFDVLLLVIKIIKIIGSFF